MGGTREVIVLEHFEVNLSRFCTWILRGTSSLGVEGSYVLKSSKQGNCKQKKKESPYLYPVYLILDHPIDSTDNSCLLILLMNQVKTSSDIYITCVSLCTMLRQKYIVLASTMELADPKK